MYLRFENTGLVNDDRMVDHKCLWYPSHIEKPERYLCSLQRCEDYNLIQKCVPIPSRFATEDELLLVHGIDYINVIKNSSCLDNLSELEVLSSKFDSVYFHPKTYDAALLAAGSAIELISAVLKGKVSNGMAVIRPPGHHAMVGEACGFCFFNNVAIAAKYALKNFNLSKILIIDWDVHHGQATQQIFYNDPRVLYFSIHRYQHGEFWPHLRESNFDFTGGKSAQGFNVNVPLNSTGLGNAEYLAIFHNILLPLAYEFCPELILISAGYDAALGCPEGEMKVTPQLYPHLLNAVSSLASGRICVVLEGGYCLPSLSESVALTLRSLLGYPCPNISPCSDINESAVESILNVISVQRPFWDSLKLQNVYDLQCEDDNVIKHVVCPKYAGNPLKGVTVFPTRDCCPVQDSETISTLEKEIKNLILKVDLNIGCPRTCVVYDPKKLRPDRRKENRHESVQPMTHIMTYLESKGIFEKCFLLHCREATEAELTLVHDKSYVDNMKLTYNIANSPCGKIEDKYDLIYTCQDSYESAAFICGSVLNIVDDVATRYCVNGFVLLQPPGHSVSERTSGTCMFNSIAIAANHLLSRYKMQRILIVDWGVHHRIGTQRVFYKNKNVLYISLHLYDGDFFPVSPEADYTAVGEGDGEGYNINIPFSNAVCDGDFLAAFFHIILPIAYEFCPDCVLVSAGFDAVHSLGGFNVTPVCCGIVIKLLSGLCNGGVVLGLEAECNTNISAEAAFHFIKALLGEPPVVVQPSSPTANGIKSIQNVVKVHKKFWNCLKFDVEVPDITSDVMEDLDSSEKCKIKLLRSSDPVAIPKKAAEPANIEVSNYKGAEGLSNEMQFYCVTPLEYCPHLELLQQIPIEGLNPFAVCQACNDPNENWVCLHCYQVYCGRFINQHMLQHGMDMQHYLTLSYSDLSVWCYGCDSYVHNATLLPIKAHACEKKFR